MAKEAGLPLMVYLELAGWSEDDLANLANNPEMQARQDLIENLGVATQQPAEEENA